MYIVDMSNKVYKIKKMVDITTYWCYNILINN